MSTIQTIYTEESQVRRIAGAEEEESQVRIQKVGSSSKRV